MGLLACAVLVQAHSALAQSELQPQALTHAGIHSLRQIDPNLTGSGARLAALSRSITYTENEPQNDYRPSTAHSCFDTKDISFHDQAEITPGISAHCTAVCSILLGEDPDGFDPGLGQFYYQGAAPGAAVAVHELWYFLVNNVITGKAPEADILTASIGTQFEQWWTRGLESLVEQTGLIVVAGIGNGSDVHDPILYPAGGANIIGVGVVDSVKAENPTMAVGRFALAYPEHSSLGPTEDGRCKPDIVAPGNCLAADGAEPNRYEPTGNYSSFSTPVVAGAIALLVQKAKQEPELSLAVVPNGGNCVMKAIVMNSATKLPYWHKGLLETDDDHVAPLDHIQGAGMLDAVGAYEHLVAGPSEPGDVSETGWDNNALERSEGTANTYKLTLSKAGGEFITATVVWNKHYESTYPFEAMPEKDSNLRLELWAVDPNNPRRDYLLDYSDSPVDNVEHIHRQADPNYTNYELIVSHSGVDGANQGSAVQQYAVAWNVGSPPEIDEALWYDLNADGVLNDSDLDTLVYNYVTYKPPGGYFMGDINSNGTFDTNDLETFLSRTRP
ncbi:MAG: S8 family serine peptidase [Planctomycetota bacterium]